MDIGEKWIDVQYGAQCADPEIAQISAWAQMQGVLGLGNAAKSMFRNSCEDVDQELPLICSRDSYFFQPGTTRCSSWKD